MFRQKFPLLQNLKRWKIMVIHSYLCTTTDKQNVKVSTCFKKHLEHKCTTGNLLPLPIHPETSSDINQFLDRQQEASKKLVSYCPPVLPSLCEGLLQCFSNFPMHVNLQEILWNVRFTNSVVNVCISTALPGEANVAWSIITLAGTRF